MKRSFLKKLISKGYMVIECEYSDDNKCSVKEIAALLKSFSSSNSRFSTSPTLDIKLINLLKMLQKLWISEENL